MCVTTLMLSSVFCMCVCVCVCVSQYRKAEPAWEVLLDIDALGKTEGKSWVCINNTRTNTHTHT